MNYILTIAWLYPDLMSTYGDRGNVIVLNKRGQWRNIDVKVEEITLETPISKLVSCDLIFMGGAQDRQQKLVGEDFLKQKGPVVKDMVERGIPALFVCAAYQFVGHYYRPHEGADIPGAGIFDLVTIHPGDQGKRCIGNAVAEIIPSNVINVKNVKNFKNFIVGFENHGGRTYLGKKILPFARVIRGYGNNGKDGFEGAVYKHAIGSYFHGPLLPKNPHIADWLISKALEMKYKKIVALKQLDDDCADRARRQIEQRII